MDLLINFLYHFVILSVFVVLEINRVFRFIKDDRNLREYVTLILQDRDYFQCFVGMNLFVYLFMLAKVSMISELSSICILIFVFPLGYKIVFATSLKGLVCIRY